MGLTRIWYPQPLQNLVYEAIRELSRGGETPVRDSDLLAYLRGRRIDVSKTSLIKVLTVLETIGYIRTLSSGDEIDIRLLR